jgi:hypothetical protein
VRRSEAERAAVDRPLGADNLGIGAGLEGLRRLSVERAEHDAELVEEDLLAGAVGVEIGRVDDLPQLGLDEEVAEDRELDGEVADVLAGGLSLREPGRVRVRDHDGVVADDVVGPVLEGGEVTAWGAGVIHRRLPRSVVRRSDTSICTRSPELVNNPEN